MRPVHPSGPMSSLTPCSNKITASKTPGDPGPDSRSRGLNDPVNEQVGDHKRERIDGKVQRSKRINTGSGIKTAHIPLPLRTPPKGGESRQRRPATSLAKLTARPTELRRAAGRASRYWSREPI